MKQNEGLGVGTVALDAVQGLGADEADPRLPGAPNGEEVPILVPWVKVVQARRRGGVSLQ